jgi:hypothetical protein
MDEFYAAMEAAIKRGDGYILPVLMDDVSVPAELLNPAIGYLRATDHTPDKLAAILAEKVGVAQRQHRQPRDVSAIVEEAVPVRLPRVAPTSFSRQDALDAALVQLGQKFQHASRTLEPYNYSCRVKVTDAAVVVRVEERGDPVCELRLREGDATWSGKVTVSFGWPRLTGDGINGWLTAEWDVNSQQAKLRYDDFSRMGSGHTTPLVTIDELFGELWEKIVRFIEQRTRHH